MISHNVCVCIDVCVVHCFVLFYWLNFSCEQYAAQTIEFNSKLMGKIEPVNGTMTQPSEYRTYAITKPSENAAKKCDF